MVVDGGWWNLYESIQYIFFSIFQTIYVTVHVRSAWTGTNHIWFGCTSWTMYHATDKHDHLTQPWDTYTDFRPISPVLSLKGWASSRGHRYQFSVFDLTRNPTHNILQGWQCKNPTAQLLLWTKGCTFDILLNQ